MKFPRWLVVTLLTVSVLAVFSAGAWWWVTWPERTAIRFTALMADEKFDEAEKMLGEPPDEIWWPVVPWPEDGWHQWSHGPPNPVSRSLSDVIRGRQNFIAVSGYRFSVKMGAVHRRIEQ
jgi:hypothetical protein